MSGFLSHIWPEAWLACLDEQAAASEYATFHQSPPICIFGTSLPGYWLAIVWSLIFLAYTYCPKNFPREKPSAKDHESGLPSPAAGQVRANTSDGVWILLAVVLLLGGTAYMLSYVTSALGWRWMILGAWSTPPSAISMSILMVYTYVIIFIITNRRRITGAITHSELKAVAIRSWKISGWLMVVQTAAYLLMLWSPSARWCFRSSLFFVLELFVGSD